MRVRCGCCHKWRNAVLADVLICRDCDTAPHSRRIPDDGRRGCPPNMPGADNGFLYPQPQEGTA